MINLKNNLTSKHKQTKQKSPHSKSKSQGAKITQLSGSETAEAPSE